MDNINKQQLREILEMAKEAYENGIYGASVAQGKKAPVLIYPDISGEQFLVSTFGMYKINN